MSKDMTQQTPSEGVPSPKTTTARIDEVRRTVTRALSLVGGGAVVFPSVWKSPVYDIMLSPAHAQCDPAPALTTEGAPEGVRAAGTLQWDTVLPAASSNLYIGMETVYVFDTVIRAAASVDRSNHEDEVPPVLNPVIIDIRDASGADVPDLRPNIDPTASSTTRGEKTVEEAAAYSFTTNPTVDYVFYRALSALGNSELITFYLGRFRFTPTAASGTIIFGLYEDQDTSADNENFIFLKDTPGNFAPAANDILTFRFSNAQQPILWSVPSNAPSTAPRSLSITSGSTDSTRFTVGIKATEYLLPSSVTVEIRGTTARNSRDSLKSGHQITRVGSPAEQNIEAIPIAQPADEGVTVLGADQHYTVVFDETNNKTIFVLSRINFQPISSTGRIELGIFDTSVLPWKRIANTDGTDVFTIHFQATLVIEFAATVDDRDYPLAGAPPSPLTLPAARAIEGESSTGGFTYTLTNFPLGFAFNPDTRVLSTLLETDNSVIYQNVLATGTSADLTYIATDTDGNRTDPLIFLVRFVGS